jgi:hypothetical protein
VSATRCALQLSITKRRALSKSHFASMFFLLIVEIVHATLQLDRGRRLPAG